MNPSPGKPPSFNELFNWALEGGRDGVLDLKLAEIEATIPGSDRVRVLLKLAFAVDPQVTVGGLLSGAGAAAQAILKSGSPSQLEELAGALSAHLRFRVARGLVPRRPSQPAGRPGAAPAPQAAPPAKSPGGAQGTSTPAPAKATLAPRPAPVVETLHQEIRQFAAENGLTHWLSKPLRMAVEDRVDRPTLVGLIDALGNLDRVRVERVFEDVAIGKGSRSSLSAGQLADTRRAVYDWLETGAAHIRARRAQDEECARLRARPIDSPVLRDVEARLLPLRARLREQYEPLLFSLGKIAVSFYREPMQLVYELRGTEMDAAGTKKATVTIGLDDWRVRGVTLSCSCKRSDGADCAHTLTALEAVLSLLHTAGPRDVEMLADALGQSRWEKALRLLGGDEAPTAPEGRVAWVIDPSDVVTLTPVIQRPNAIGTWTTGDRADVSILRKYREWTAFPAAARVGELFDSPGGLGEYTVFHALELLAGYPHVFLRGQKTPVTIRRAEPQVLLERTPEGDLELITSVDGDREAAEQVRTALARRSSHFVILARPERHEVLLVPISDPMLQVARAINRGTSRFPPESHAQLLERLTSLEAVLPLKLPAELQGREIEADRRLILRLTPIVGGALDLELRVRPLASGPRFAPGEGPVRLTGVAGRERVHAQRDLADEVARARALLASLTLTNALHRDEWALQLPDADTSLDLVAHLSRLGDKDLVVEWPQEPLKVTRPATPSHLKVRVENRRDWFGIDGEVELDGERVKLALLLDAARRGTRYVAVGPGRFVALSEELRARLLPASDVLYEGRSGLEASPAAASALGELTDGAGETEVCDEWRSLTTRMAASREADYALPDGLKAELRHYQLDGYRWLCRLERWGIGACLADDMGLGKTLQAIAMLLRRAGRGPALVVAPTSVCFNWMREMQRFAPSLNGVLLREGDREATLAALKPGDVLVTSYGLLLQHAEQLAAIRFATVVVDEAQAIKNSATRRARAVRDLDAEWRIALTGTPVENHLGELWSLFRVIAPGLLGSWEQFRERFAGPIEREKDAARRAALARVVRPFILRRTKAAVAPELPARTEIRDVVTLSAAERRLYEDARLAALARVAGAEGAEGTAPEQKRFLVLAAITRLRQIACHPRLYEGDSTVPSSKLARLMQLVEELRENGHRALVFSQFTSHLTLVREALDLAKVPYLYLDGATPEAERIKRVDAFQRGEAELFLISLKAGGTGLNLTAADYVFHLDPWWNPAVEDQATDRAHRIGQQRPVTVYRLVAKGTIEEAILALHEEKRDLVAGVLDGSDAAARLSTDEMVELIRTGEGEVAAETGDESGDDLEGGAEVRAQAIAALDPAAALQAAAQTADPAVETSGLQLSAIDVRRVLDLFDAQIDTKWNAATARSYRRALQRFGEFVSASELSQRTLQDWSNAYLDAVARKTFPAPASETTLGRTVLNHVLRFVDARQ